MLNAMDFLDCALDLELEPGAKRRKGPYRCKKCGQIKAGHICTGSKDSKEPIIITPNSERPATKFTCCHCSQRIHFGEMLLCSSCMGVAIHKNCAKTMELSWESSWKCTNCHEKINDSDTPCKPFIIPQFTTTNKRGPYKCSTCGQPTKGHKCPGPVVSVQSFLGEL